MPRTRKTWTNPNQEESESPQKSERPSSEIDVDEVLRLAREADERAKLEPEVPKRGRRKTQPVNGQEVSETPAPVIETDPEFVEMCKWGVGSVVEIAQRRLDWSDPGIHWKEKVSTIVARIVQRLQPMEPSLLTDCLIVSGYTALWVLPNVASTLEAKRRAKDTAAVRNDGKRQDVETPGTLGAI